MTSTTVKFSESQKTQQDKKTLTVHIYISISHKQKQILICCCFDILQLFISILIYFDILHLIFCDFHGVGDCQKAFFDTIVEYTTCKFLGNYLNDKHNRHTTCYLSLKEKKLCQVTFK